MEWRTHYTSAAATTKTLSNSVASIRDNVAKRARARASKEKRVKMPDQKCKEGKMCAGPLPLLLRRHLGTKVEVRGEFPILQLQHHDHHLI